MNAMNAGATYPSLELLANRWWTFVVRGVAALLFGILALAMPLTSLLALVYLWGAFAIVEGGLALAAAARSGRSGGRWGWFLFEGLVSIAAGIVAFAWPGMTGVVLLVVIAMWAILSGIAQIGAAVNLRGVIEREWILGLTGTLSLVFGIIIIARPAVGALSVAWLIGLYAIALGVMLIALGIKLRKLGQADERMATRTAAHAPA